MMSINDIIQPRSVYSAVIKGDIKNDPAKIMLTAALTRFCLASDAPIVINAQTTSIPAMVA